VTILSKQSGNDSQRIRIIAAFGIIYFVWGTTYLAIRLAIDTIPPFLMAGIRFTIAGILLFGWSYWRFDKKPGLSDWGKAAIPGILMFVGGNGLLTWSETFLPSGLAALIIATVSIWMVVLDWFFFSKKRPDKLTLSGIAIGLAGVALLTGVGDEVLINGGSVILGILVLTFASMSWAAGSLVSRNLKSATSLQFTISMQILAGGLALLVVGSLQGEWAQVSFQAISLQSFFALSYLILLGTLLAYSAYLWLLRVSTPAKVSTYAFFNPLIAVFLGSILLDEPVTLETIIGALCILVSLLLVNQLKFRKKQQLNSPQKVIAFGQRKIEEEEKI
jgi:drug/metabolite transporter (DMT)-like permease